MPPPATAPNVTPGDVLAGKYRVERVIGAGGMGVVVAAQHIALKERVALKFLLPNALFDVNSIGRFVREAQTAVRIKSEHVARITDVGTLDDGAPYIVMEYLEGVDLATLLQQRGPLPVAEAVAYLLQAAEALDEAHSLGIIHRDIKLANLFLTQRRDGTPLLKVLDFGISKVVESTEVDHALTATGAVLGSPAYMSPEQARSSKNVDARTDIWSLGTVLYELLSAQQPFSDSTLMGLVAKIIADPPAPLRANRPDVPAALEAVVLQCLEKNPAHRPQTIAELATLLAPFAPPTSEVSLQRVAGIRRAAPGSDPSFAIAPTVSRAEGFSDTGGDAMVKTGHVSTEAQARARRFPPMAMAMAVVAALVVIVGVALVPVARNRGKVVSEAVSEPRAINAPIATPPQASETAAAPPPPPPQAAPSSTTSAPAVRARGARGPRAPASAAPRAATSAARPPTSAAPVINTVLETER